MNKRLFFTVTNDLSFDQRMIRICSSLAGRGYQVLLVGRTLPDSPPLEKHPFGQKRISVWFQKGKLFYFEYNIKLFIYLIFNKIDLICAIDLDTILPCLVVAGVKRIPKVYDAHELFCEMKEVASRPRIQRIWKGIEKLAVPRFKNGYTVNSLIAQEFKKMYNVDYEIIRNLPELNPGRSPAKGEPYILYQGAVNEGRSFETLIPAMQEVKVPLLVCGDGNFLDQAKELAHSTGVTEKIRFLGRIPPSRLQEITRSALLGITLFDGEGLSNYFSLANRFFDYIQAGIPQICVDFPAYREINNSIEVAVLIKDLRASTIAHAINQLLEDPSLYDRLEKNCQMARTRYNWELEEKKLFKFYQKLLPV